MFFNYLKIIFEFIAHVFRAIGVCVIILPIAGFLGFVALDRCEGVTAILGILAAGMVVIMAAAAVYMELEQAVDEVRSFRYWRAAVQKM